MFFVVGACASGQGSAGGGATEFTLSARDQCRSIPAALTDSAAVRLAKVLHSSASISDKALDVRRVLPEVRSFESLEASGCALRRLYMPYHPAYINSEQYYELVERVVPVLFAAEADAVDQAFMASTPHLISPAEGSVLDGYPRRTTLSWEPVPGAAHYIVDVEVRVKQTFVRQGRAVS